MMKKGEVQMCYGKTVSLIAGGCPQFMDFETDVAKLAHIQRHFEERRDEESGTIRLCPLHMVDGCLVDMDEKPAQGDSYRLNIHTSLDGWLKQWIPVPFLRQSDQGLEQGPSNWARAYLTRLEGRPDTLHLVLAFDMRMEDWEEGRPYIALRDKDVRAHGEFRLAWRCQDVFWFLEQAWVDDWLRETWYRSHPRSEDDTRQLEYRASYLLLLEVLRECTGQVEKVCLISPWNANTVDVDLVLDIGNSRTTGMLVETYPQEITSLRNHYLLQLRDMDQPEHVHTEPFETRIEFSEICFGNEALSQRSGRRMAFAFPSPVRIGPEAARLATLSRGAQGSTGMSSPKRYLWDKREWQQTWRYNTRGGDEPYATRGLLMRTINFRGTPLRHVRNTARNEKLGWIACEALYTRSSMMMLLLVEIFQQALLTINAPAQRIRHRLPNFPRRLRQIIFTVPPGMPIAEQRIYRRWARWAVSSLWDALGWQDFYSEKASPRKNDGRTDYRTSPQVRCNWDEATCTQLVYLYNEIYKYQGNVRQICELMGRPRPEYGGPCLRVASIDIGGGTTDLSITTFELADERTITTRMIPHVEFRDGFNLAGDDVLFGVIRDCVLSAVEDALTEAGIPDAAFQIKRLFSDSNITWDERHRRIQFIRQIAVPVALSMLEMYEKKTPRADFTPINCTLRDYFHFPVRQGNGRRQEENGATDRTGDVPFSTHPAPNAAALDYLEQEVKRLQPGSRFSLLDIPMPISFRNLHEAVRRPLRGVLSDLCEVIHHYDCDLLLLTGRPSRWHGIVSTIFANMPVPPDRIVPMNDYHVGEWYPFCDACGRITDPKTTVVAGAILCALAEGQLQNFSLDSGKLKVKSTARYIGQMARDGQIRNDMVWFGDIDVNPRGTQEYEPDLPEGVEFAGPIAVGFRQLPVQRWTTTRFYLIEFSSPENQNRYRDLLPFTIDCRFSVTGTDNEMPANEEDSECSEELRITNIVDNRGAPVDNDVLSIRLQTLPREEGFWLDTGIMYAG